MGHGSQPANQPNGRNRERKEKENRGNPAWASLVWSISSPLSPTKAPLLGYACFHATEPLEEIILAARKLKLENILERIIVVELKLIIIRKKIIFFILKISVIKKLREVTSRINRGYCELL